jgi:RNA polymerase sigma factor (sigma-70 family)
MRATSLERSRLDMGDPTRNYSGNPNLTRLDALFRAPLMRYFQRRVGSRAEAEDLTQSVFVRLLGVGEAGEIEHAPAYVFTIAANLLKDRKRKMLRQAENTDLDPDLVSDLMLELSEERTPERVLLGREALTNLLGCLDELGERTRDIFILFRLEHMKQRDIAALYGIGQSTVEKHVMKAALHLLRKSGVT